MTQVKIPAGKAQLEGVLELPGAPRGVVAFSHGSGSGRKSPRNRFVAAELRRAGVGTLLLDLLTERLGAAVRLAVRAVVSRGGRPDLTGRTGLARVKAPTLLVVGANPTGLPGTSPRRRPPSARSRRRPPA